MSHLYPLASSAEEALKEAEVAALTRYEAEALANGHEVIKLETEWLKPDSGNILEIMDTADAGPGQGFIQRYEDEAGEALLAITYWKLGDVLKAGKQSPVPPQENIENEDHTDDLYFREGRTKPARKRHRKKYIDPRQMDMFSAPEETED